MNKLEEMFDLNELERTYLRTEIGSVNLEKIVKAFRAFSDPKNYSPAQVSLDKYGSENTTEKLDPRIALTRTVDEIRSDAQKVIIGKDEQINDLIHFIKTRVSRQQMLNAGTPYFELPKSSALIIAGESGSGKSFVVNNVCRAMNCDFIEIPLTLITGPGWRGGDLGDYYKKIAQLQDENENNFTIVFFDEVDKHAFDKSSYVDKSSNPTLELLALLDCHEGIFVYPEQGSSDEKPTVIDTNRCAFIFAGAFADIDSKVIAERIGPTQNLETFFEVTKQYNQNREIISKFVTHKLRELLVKEDLVTYGLSEEFVGRCGMFINMPPMTEEEIKLAISEEHHGLIHKYRNLIERDFTIEISEVALGQLVEKILGGSGGTRAIEDLLMSPMMRLVNDAQLNSSCAGAALLWDPIKDKLDYELVS